MPISFWLNAFIAAISVGIAMPAAAAGSDSVSAPTVQVDPQPATSADATSVGTPNCLLPGQIHSFGGIATVTPRRTAALPKADCAARGGEPIIGTTPD
jgi:hypothetical protein